MADDADEAPPRLAFLFTQRLADVGQHDEIVRLAALPEPPPPDLPSPGRPGKLDVVARGIAMQRVGSRPRSAACRPDMSSKPLAEQTLAVAVHQHQPALAVEREDRDVDLGHHRVQQRRRFLGAEPLRAQRVRQAVDLPHDDAEGVGVHREPGPNGEVAFAQGREQVRDGLERTDEPIADRHGHRRPSRRRRSRPPSAGRAAE